MLNQKQILQWAIKGISSEIDELEKSVNKGQQLLKDLNEGKQIKSPLNEYEINEIIKTKRKEIDRLANEHFELRWQLSEIEQ